MGEGREKTVRTIAGGIRVVRFYLGEQKLPVEVPRVRNLTTGKEVTLEPYKKLQSPVQLDEKLLLKDFVRFVLSSV